MINVTKNIYDKLVATTAVTDIAGTRIWGDRSTPIKTYRPDAGAAIAFEPRGGIAKYDQRVFEISYKFKFYGSTNDAADSPQLSAFELYAAVHDALVDSTFGNVRWAGVEITYQSFEEFALNWPYAVAFFAFRAID